MNVEDAAHAIAHDYPGGLALLAERMGIGRTVFNGKVNPNDKGHVLGLVESLRMQQLANRFDILYAMADELGFVCMKKPDACGDVEVALLLANTCSEFGDYMREITEAMSDRTVTKNEAKRMQKELLELITAATRLNSHLTALSDR